MRSYNSTRAVWNSGLDIYPSFNKISGDITVDVAIIGGGITGISAAYLLSRKGYNVAVLEAGKVGEGSTGSSTGNLYVPTSQYQTILSKHDQKGLDAVVSARSMAMTFIEDRIREFNIACSYRRVPWHYFTNSKSSVKSIQKEYKALMDAGLPVSDKMPDGFPFPALSIVTVSNQAQFNPLVYVKKLAEAIVSDNCKIYENVKVLKISDGDPCKLETSEGKVKARYVIQATHTPKGIYAVHAIMEVYREYALALKISGELPANGIYWMRQGKSKYSIRTYNDGKNSFLIVLNDTHKTGQKEKTERSFKKVEKHIKSFFKVEEISYLWAAQNYSSADYLPYIGTSPMQKNIYIATGFADHGLTYGTSAAMIIADLITGQENPLSKVFDPKRLTIAASAGKALKENITVVSNLLKDYVFKRTDKELSSIKKGKAKIVEFEGEKAGAYRDESGLLHVVNAKCPHMGCIVHWNSAEKSWDCPCHGSRFTFEGVVLEGPAIHDLKRYSIQ